METIPQEAVSYSETLTARRENVIERIARCCHELAVSPPSEAELAEMSLEQLEDRLSDLDASIELAWENRQMHMEDEWLDSRMEEGFDPYVGGYTDDC